MEVVQQLALAQKWVELTPWTHFLHTGPLICQHPLDSAHTATKHAMAMTSY